MKIHLVVAVLDYENSYALRAFEDETDAQTFAKKCADYDRKQPATPSPGAPDAEWDKHWRSMKRWESRHPAKPYSNRDSYRVESVPFITKEQHQK